MLQNILVYFCTFYTKQIVLNGFPDVLDPSLLCGAKGHFSGGFQFALASFIILHCYETVSM